MALREDAQSGMFDREVDDDELEQAIDVYMTTRQMASTHGAAKREIKKRMKHLGLELTETSRIRVGRFVMTGKRYDGGDVEIPPWSVVSPSFSALD